VTALPVLTEDRLVPTPAAVGANVDLAPRRSLSRALLRDPLAVVGLGLVVVLALACIGAPWLTPYDPAVVDATARLAGPTAAHPLGTDELGRDLLSRLLHGGRWSLGIACLATLVVMVVGISVGLVSGFYGGLLDAVLMRVVDVLLAFPPLLLYLAVVGTLGPGVRNVFLALVAIAWAEYARVVRGLVVSARRREYVLAAQALGARSSRIMLRHILPNVVSPVVVLGTLQVGRMILTLAALGFFGLGAQPPTPEWGTMINQSRLFLQSEPMLMIAPGLAISLAVLGFNLVGDGLRDALDPRTARTRRTRSSRRRRSEGPEEVEPAGTPRLLPRG
jgi:peptide/nickel transport system permease protein